MSGLSSSKTSHICPAFLTSFDFLAKILGKIDLSFSKGSEIPWESPFIPLKNSGALGHHLEPSRIPFPQKGNSVAQGRKKLGEHGGPVAG